MGTRGTLIYLLRHGDVGLGERRRFIGHLDLPLSPLGEQQGAAQAERLRRARLASVVASDLARARRTGELIAAPHALPLTVVPALREMSMGRWEGLTADEISAREPEAFAAWRRRIGEFPFPEGESLADLASRAWPAFQTIVAAHPDEAIAVVAHGGTNRVLVCQALGMPLDRILALGQDYGALTVLAHADGAWHLHRLNEGPTL
jgi:broad specificity phosphatase PhoE